MCLNSPSRGHLTMYWWPPRWMMTQTRRLRDRELSFSSWKWKMSQSLWVCFLYFHSFSPHILNTWCNIEEMIININVCVRRSSMMTRCFSAFVLLVRCLKTTSTCSKSPTPVTGVAMWGVPSPRLPGNTHTHPVYSIHTRSMYTHTPQWSDVTCTGSSRKVECAVSGEI